MRLAHLADLHLGFRQYHRQTAGGFNQREMDVAAAFRAAVAGVIAARPDAVVVAGDVFHSVRPTNAAILLAFEQFSRLRAALPDAPIVVIAGNHDTPRSSETGSILRLFESLRIDVVTDAARRLDYPQLDLSVFAVPHPAFFAPERPSLRAEGAARYRVLVTHGEVEGVFPVDRTCVEYGGAILRPEELAGGDWTYVALGHYHVQCEVAPRVWYAGALDYVSPNCWGEARDEEQRGLGGKAWLLADLDRGEVEAQRVPLARRVIDLEPIDATGRTVQELDQLVARRVRSVPGGIGDQIVRLLVWNVPRHVGRQLDHAAVRGYKAEALHFHLDLRRPEVHRLVGMGSPGRRQTLGEIVTSYLSRRLLPADVDREAFVRLGGELLDAVEREHAES